VLYSIGLIKMFKEKKTMWECVEDIEEEIECYKKNLAA
jgi:hypothetical protein